MEKSPTSSVRFLTAFLILLFSIAAFYPLSVRFLAQYNVAGADRNILHAKYTAAVQQLLKAVDLQPKDFQIHNKLGNVFYKLGSANQDGGAAQQQLGKAADHYQQAFRLHPLDARSAYGLARTEIRIEKNNFLAGKSSPSLKTSPAFKALEQAIELRPSSSIYHLTLARYLYLHDETDRLLAEMRILGSLQPSIYGTLRQEPLWTPAARSAFIKGVEQALAEGTATRQTNLVAAELMVAENRWQEAISYREQGMEIQPSLNTSADFVRLGYLYLKDRQPGQAQSRFFVAITMSEDIERDILNILQTCRNAKEPESLVEFYRDVSKVHGSSNRIDITAARHLFDLKEFDNARIILTENTSIQPNSEAYYWLSRIAENDLDWDEVEVNMQKAAMHAFANSGYHLRFSQVLNRLQKYERAEKEAGLAIKFSEEPNGGLYAYRAGLRKRLKDLAGALEDLQQAINLEPENASFHFQAGDVLEKMAMIDEAAEYFQKAIELEPKNKSYVKRLERIEKKYGAGRER
jgi:tetratricopeptide (TPR) repeat protein